MKTILEAATRGEVIRRIGALSGANVAEWGKMNVRQMVVHCAISEESYLGKKTYKRAFLGRVFGPSALKNIIKDDRPLGRDARTLPDFLVDGDGDLESGKKNWIALVHEYDHLPSRGIVHWFFGEMTREQVGIFAYKHNDHHLRQFGC